MATTFCNLMINLSLSVDFFLWAVTFPDIVQVVATIRWDRKTAGAGSRLENWALIVSFPLECCCSVVKSCLTLRPPWTAAFQASLSSTLSRSFLKFMSIEVVIISNHLILSCPLLLLPSVFPSIKVFSNESALRIKGSEYWSFSFGIFPSSEYSFGV